MAEPFDRKAALRAYKERRPRPGIYAVRERATGRAWAGSAPDLDTTRNGLWHTLHAGRHLDRDLQAAWTRLGEAAFEFVILEVLEEEQRVCFRIPASRDGDQPRDPARKRAQGDAGHRPSAVTQLGARLATVPPGWGGGRRLASSRALNMEPPCLRALS